MEILRKLKSFNPPHSDLVNIYILYIRCILEQSGAIWHSSLSKENSTDLERVQKNALRNILQERYIDYEAALKILKLETLEKQREKLLSKYGRQCLKLERTKQICQKKQTLHNMNTRNKNMYLENQAHTERYRKSAVPFIQRFLNSKN